MDFELIYLLHQTIDRSADRNPDRPAFRFLGQTLTYADLVERSNALARTLVDAGVRRGDRVGIYLNKGLEIPIAVYGIMKAGATFVPLDPGAPPSRLRKVIGHCGVRVLVPHPTKTKGLRNLLEGGTGLAWIIGVDDAQIPGIHSIGWAAVDSAPAHRPPDRRVMEGDLAYIMYTSGSTGSPKGIMHTHASGLSYARLAAETYALRPDDRLANHSPLHFDMSTLDYFSGPLRGACTAIIPEAYTKLPASLSKLVEDERLTIWYSVPYALIQLLLRGLPEERDLSSLRWALFGGEPFPPKHLNALRRLLPGARFSNVYGPAEVNQCTFYHVPPDAPDTDTPVPIGRVWPNAEGLVVDEQDRPVPRGDAGELLIRAPTMMRGYWEQPELNAQAFFRRPLTAGIDDIFYRTGDLVRERADGELEFLGRKDRQIKTRGHRVELDEVESVLAGHPDVEEAAAYAVPGDHDSARIEAAVVLRTAAGATVQTLLEHCAQNLPNYAVPTLLSERSSFPRTTSNKIDRRALREEAMMNPARDSGP